MSATSASAVAGASSAGLSAPLSEEEKKRCKNQKKNVNRKAKNAFAKVETSDTPDQGNDGDDAVSTNGLSTSPAINPPTGIPAKGKGKPKADDAISVTSANGVPPDTLSRDKDKAAVTNIDIFAASNSAAENWMKPSSTCTMTPEETQTLAAHFMAKFCENKERHRAISPPRRTTQYTAEEKYQHVIAGMLKSQGVTSRVKTRTQVRREGANPEILRTEWEEEMPELAKQISDMIVADNEALKAKEKEINGKEGANGDAKKVDDDALEMSDEQLLDSELIKKGSLSQLRVAVAQIDLRIAIAQSEVDVFRPLAGASSKVFRLFPPLAEFEAQRNAVAKELALLKVEDRVRRAFLKEDTTYDGRRGRMGMLQGCAVLMDDPPMARSIAAIEACAMGGGFEREEDDDGDAE